MVLAIIALYLSSRHGFELDQGCVVTTITQFRSVVGAPPGDPEALIEEARARQRRRRVRLVVAGVVLAAVGAAVYGGFGGAANQPPTLPVIERNLAGALTTSRTRLILRFQTHRTSSQVVNEISWVNLANGRKRVLNYGASGRLLSAASNVYSRTAGGSISENSLTVTYSSKTWSASTGSLECGDASTSGCTFPRSPIEACGCDLDPFTSFAKDHLRVALLGDETVDGQPTFHLRFTITGTLFARQRYRLTINYWIDRETSLPVRDHAADRSLLSNGQLGPPQPPVMTDFAWLPRSRATLADLNIVVPPGFKKSIASP